jgi:hypothetical protein
MRLAPIVLALVLGALTLISGASAQTLTKQFTYQGYLENNGVPYTGNASIVFGIYAAQSGGNPRDTVTIPNVAVSKGVFTALLNFGDTDTSGAPIYDGRALFLQLTVDIGSGSFSLTPRQPIQPAPYALALPNVSPNGANVGIGTATPASKLDVIGETRTTSLEVTGGVIVNGGAVTATTDLGLYSLNSGAWMRLVSNNGPIHFFTNSTQGASGSPTANSAAMTIAASGNVGVGLSAPSAKFEVQTAGTSAATLRSSNAAGTWLGLSNSSVGGHDWSVISTGSANGEGAGKLLFHDQGNVRMMLDTSGNVGIGLTNPTEKLHVNGNIRAKVVIIEGGADLAESYDVAAAEETTPKPGMVVSIDPDRVGKLRIASKAYDRAVAGIISGADGVAPGLVLGQKGTVADGEHPIANVGRVWCFVDADAGGPVSPGDLLTTSSTPGHAMRAADQSRAGGATLGKAMSRLESGKGLVLVLVTLQ